MRAPVALLVVLLSGCGARSGLGNAFEGSAEIGDVSVVDDSSAEDGTDDPDSGGFSPDVGEDAPDVFDVPVVEDTGGPVTSCPPVLPKLGASCTPPLDCAYVGCDLVEKDRATCVGGKWAITAAACVSGLDRCPVGLPVSGSPCTLSDHTGCTWSTKCVADTVGWCVGGTWAIKGGGCVPDAACPSSFPSLGTACSKKPGACSYFNECGVLESAGCVDGVWRGERFGCELSPECPSKQPPNGSTCTPGSRPMCVWKNACGGVDYGRCGWLLGEGKWTIFHPPCPATSCPTTPPTDAACAKEGLACTYPIGAGCTLKCSCSGGAWTCIQDACVSK